MLNSDIFLSYLQKKIMLGLNDIQYLHLSNQLISYRKHKLTITEVSKEASNQELSFKLWEISEELCNSFGTNLIDL